MLTKVIVIALLISAIAATSPGFALYGYQTSYFGESTAVNGDVNGDGISDLVVGAPDSDVAGNDDGNDNGIVFVLFGSSTFSNVLGSNSLSGSTGMVINGLEESELGYSVAIGDVNHDGIGDIIMGAKYAFNYSDANNDDSNPGAVFVVFGSKTLPSVFNITELDGTNGFGIFGEQDEDEFGAAVAAGDVNGDNIADILVGATDATGVVEGSGAAYVMFGHSTAFTTWYQAASLTGSAGFKLLGNAEDDTTGLAVAAGGDFNDDSIGDILVGAPNTDTANQDSAGTVYAVFGTKTPTTVTLSQAALTGTNGFTFTGVSNNEDDDYSSYLGESVATGDFNGDGIADIIAGAPYYNDNGAVYVIWGSKSAFSSKIVLDTLTGSEGFVIYDSGNDDEGYFGYSVTASSDFNDDGIVDLLIGAYEDYNAEDSDSGNAYIFYGTKTAFGPNFNTSQLDGTNGGVLFGIEGGDYTGYSVASGGDLNHDGISDIVIGAKYADNSNINSDGDDDGAVYVVFGQKSSNVNSFNLGLLLTGGVQSSASGSPSFGASLTSKPSSSPSVGSKSSPSNSHSANGSASPSPVNGNYSASSSYYYYSEITSAANAGPVMGLAAIFFW